LHLSIIGVMVQLSAALSCTSQVDVSMVRATIANITGCRNSTNSVFERSRGLSTCCGGVLCVPPHVLLVNEPFGYSCCQSANHKEGILPHPTL